MSMAEPPCSKNFACTATLKKSPLSSGSASFVLLTCNANPFSLGTSVQPLVAAQAEVSPLSNVSLKTTLIAGSAASVGTAVSAATWVASGLATTGVSVGTSVGAAVAASEGAAVGVR